MSADRDYTKICAADVPVNKAIILFFENFYQISDTEDEHDQYATQFTDDATLIMASKVSNGSAEILEMRKSMWSAVASRHHTVLGIYPFGGNWDKVMIYGRVDYGMRNGTQAGKDWAARAELVRKSSDGPWQMQLYQVYLGHEQNCIKFV